MSEEQIRELIEAYKREAREQTQKIIDEAISKIRNQLKKEIINDLLREARQQGGRRIG